MKTPPAVEREFEPLFVARREYEELRRSLSRGLAAWTSGEATFVSIVPTIELYEDAHKNFIEQIYAHSDVKRTAIESLQGKTRHVSNVSTDDD